MANPKGERTPPRGESVRGGLEVTKAAAQIVLGHAPSRNAQHG